jgi:hypothetical protein
VVSVLGMAGLIISVRMGVLLQTNKKSVTLKYSSAFIKDSRVCRNSKISQTDVEWQCSGSIGEGYN